MNKIAPYWKAVVGFVTPGLAVIGYAVTEASAGGEHITQGEWIAAAVACLLTGGAVFQTPNKDPKARHQAESVQPPTA